MKRAGVIRAVVGGASAAAAVGTVGGGAQASTVPPVHLSWIVAVRVPPSGEYVPPDVPDASKFAAATAATSKRINSYAIPKLIHEAMLAQSANIHAVTGATYTSRAFKNSLASAILKLSKSTSTATVYGTTYSVWAGGGLKYGVVKVEVRGHRR